MSSFASDAPIKINESQFKDLVGDLYSESLFKKLRDSSNSISEGAVEAFCFLLMMFSSHMIGE